MLACVEIDQCVGCQFFTKSFLGDDAADPARSSGEEPASPRHRAGAASMAWRRRDDSARTRREILISTQVAAKEFPENFKGTPMLSCSVTPGRTYAPCAYFTTHGLWLGRSETA